LDGLGLVFASLAACAWAAYILLGKRLGRVYPGASGLTIGVAIAALIQLPTGIASGGADLVAPEVLAVALVVAALSTVVPYAAEIEALRRLPAATFGVLMSLEPAVAALIGLIALDQGLDTGEVIGITLVVAASVGAIRTAPMATPIIE
jgi:inner membrane transporter RhtA